MMRGSLAFALILIASIDPAVAGDPAAVSSQQIERTVTRTLDLSRRSMERPASDQAGTLAAVPPGSGAQSGPGVRFYTPEATQGGVVPRSEPRPRPRPVN